MYLEKLEVQGFKSFAFKNKLIFSGIIAGKNGKKRGLTAIVGPNGSGKSNVADSIRWALGEQSLKTLRGKKSEDVIFSGSDKKNQLSLAEVSLYLNNNEALNSEALNNKTLNNTNPIEKNEKENSLDQILLSCGEIVITRRLYRSGESEYLLNNNRVRLADIQMLLAKANFGQKTYSVIGQGMVENFLNSSAAERKDFFDEATGVKQFQIKRDTALNKLENSYENLQQVNLLLNEIKPRLRSLTRQVEKLKRRSEIAQKLHNDQLDYYALLWQNINKKLNISNESLLAQEKIKLEQETKLEKLNEELNKIRTSNNLNEINELGTKLKELNEKKNQELKRLGRLEAELELRLESQGKFDISWLHNKQIELKIELEKLENEIKILNENNFSREEENLKLEQEAINLELVKNNKNQNKINQLNIEKNQYLKELNKLDAILEAQLALQEKINIPELNNKKSELHSQLNKIKEEIKTLEASNNSTKKNTLEKELKSLQEHLNQLNHDIHLINERLKKTGVEDSHKNEIKILINKFLKKLEDITKETDLNKIKKLINQAKTTFQTKIRIFISNEDKDELQKIKLIQEKIITLTEKRQNINNNLNAEQLRLNSNEDRRRLLLNQRTQIIQELEETETKLKKTENKFATNKIIEEKSIITEKINLLEKTLTDLNKNNQSSELYRKKQTNQEKIQNLHLKISTLNERLRLTQLKKDQLNQEISDINDKINKSKVKFDSAKPTEEKKEIRQRLNLLDEEIKTLNHKLTQFNQEKEAEKTKMFKYQKDIQSLQEKINLVLNELNNFRITATRQETKLEDLEISIKNDGLHLSEIKNHNLTAEFIDSEDLYQTINKNRKQLELIGGIDPEAEKEYAETKERYDFLNKQTKDLEQAIKSLEEVIYELDKNIKKRFDAEFKVIAEKFNEYFKILFKGGRAKIFKLMFSDLDKNNSNNKVPNDIDNINNEINLNPQLNSTEITIKNELPEKLKNIKFLKKHNSVGLAGIEIQATPPGKKIQTVAMLSGGERALTAIALICAIISANPSPFVVLDEVDAALDEANSERLAEILDTLSNKTQFIVITHNRACMRKASILYGVTMGNDGVSKLLSVKLTK